MTKPAIFEVMFGYHWHTIGRLMECAGRLSEADRHTHPGYGHGSLHELFFHLLRTDHNWYNLLETGKQTAPLRLEDYPDAMALQSGFDLERANWQGLLGRLTAEEIVGSMPATNWRGETFIMERWRILQHVILHGMQHFAELAQLLTAKGQSPGDIDFIFYE